LYLEIYAQLAHSDYELRAVPGKAPLLWAKTFFLGNKPMAVFTAGEGSEKPRQVKF
jgi:hypothetical protein